MTRMRWDRPRPRPDGERVERLNPSKRTKAQVARRDTDCVTCRQPIRRGTLYVTGKNGTVHAHGCPKKETR